MSEGHFEEDDIERKLYHSIPITSQSFKGLWVLSTLFSRKKPERMKNSTLSSKLKQVEINVESLEELKKLETIEI